MTPKFHTLKVTDVRRETKDTVSIAFDIPEEFKKDYEYQAGQYLTLRKEIKGEDVRRSYSICTAPSESELRVAVKHVEGGLFSTFANKTLQAGEELEVMTPMGAFTTDINPDNEKSYVFYAAGSGITPVIALVKEILSREPLSDVTLFYGNRGFSSIIFRDEIEGLKNKYIGRFRLLHILSRENMGIPLNYGHIDSDKCKDLSRTFTDIQSADAYFICGPEGMIKNVKEGLEQSGVDKNKIHFELFTSPLGSLARKKKTPSEDIKDDDRCEVKVVLDDIEYDFRVHPEEEPILDVAQSKGADLPFACKGGVCCTCKAKVLEGEVTMDVNYALEQDQVDAGYILTCQSHPKTKHVKISFDE